MKTFTTFAAAAVASAALAMAGSASAAAFVSVGTSGLAGANQIHWTGGAPGQGSVAINDITTILNFDDTLGGAFADGLMGQVAYLTLVGSTGGTGTLEQDLSNFTQTGISGYYEFRTAAAGGGTLLLRGDFQNYWITGVVGAGAGNLTELGGSGDVVFSSGLGDLSYIKNGDSSFTFSGVTPTFGITGGTLNNFSGAGVTGTFSGTVPEAGTWALMILGFGGAGAMIRRRRYAFAA